MNKKLKIATAAVSVVMAGTMAFGIVGCTPSNKKDYTYTENTYHNVESISDTTVDTKGTGDLTFYTAKGTNVPVYTTDTTLNMNVCDGGNVDRHITYGATQISTGAKLPDGNVYEPGQLKPAWKQLSTTLGVQFKDTGANRSSEKQISELISKNEQAQHHIVTGSGNAITTNTSHFLDLNQYLDYMPNYKAFLDANPIVKWSLTTNTETGAMYYAPYFDGNNDIEKYVLTHKEWTRVMLDGDVSGATRTWAESKTGKADVGTNQTYAVGEMGTTGSYKVDTTDPADETKLVKLVVNYGAALEAAKSETAELGKAYKAATGAVYAGESGNIVDIMNAAIAAKSGAITGAQLLGILRAYIDVAYQTEAGAKFYATRSDVFNSVSAGWDIDLYTALCRCVVTSNGLFGTGYTTLPAAQLYAVSGRQGTTQRRVDLNCFVGELYGVRGLESRNEYAYVDAQGNLKDARLNADTYDAMNKFSALAKEGLVYLGNSNADKYLAKAESIVTFSMHDYSQTQTTDGFYVDVAGFNGKDAAPNGLITSGDLKFDFAPIVTPVSKWDTNSDGSKETYMRFTESWRAVKNTGFCVPLAAVQNKPEEFSAVLAFIDYLFSNDGQIVGTFGTMSTNGNVAEANGFWYGNDGENILDANGNVKSAYADVVDTYDGRQYFVKKAHEGTYFAYNNAIYKGTDYLGKQVPILTDNNINYYYGKTVGGAKMGEASYDKDNKTFTGEGFVNNYAGNYTNYCRGVVGGALPIGVKSQGFEYQATSSCGLRGTEIVSKAVLSGAIKHLTQEVKADTYWYTCVPTTLPVDETNSAILNSHANLKGSDTTAGLFLNTSKTAFRTNLFIDLCFYGYGANKPIAGNDQLFAASLPADSAACLTLVSANGMTARAGIYASGWTQLKTAFMK